MVFQSVIVLSLIAEQGSSVVERKRSEYKKHIGKVSGHKKIAGP